jgi:hypothetical protein
VTLFWAGLEQAALANSINFYYKDHLPVFFACAVQHCIATQHLQGFGASWKILWSAPARSRSKLSSTRNHKTGNFNSCVKV